MKTKLMRSRDDRWVSGVLGGLAKRFGMNPLLLRAIYAILTLFTGVFLGVALYLFAIALMPQEPRIAPHVRLSDDDFYA
jgi:phage shock protein C